MSLLIETETKPSSNSGFMLAEQIIVLGISSVIMATIFMAYNLTLTVFDEHLDDAMMQTELRDAISYMKYDLRDANAVIYPPAAGLLITFVSISDGITYSYYINANKSLVREAGVTGLSGTTISHNMDPLKTSVSMIGNLVSIKLQADIDGHINRVTGSVKPRNI
ncbi:MAG: hypothetical protein OEM38_05175 [Gammaproteobacteria bacterium]|nr:hypothetical protein [Gammaproteobacteria bacterium]